MPPSACTTKGLNPPGRRKPPFRGPIIGLLLSVVGLTGLAPGGRAQQAATGGREAQSTRLLHDAGGLALNGREVDTLPVDPLKPLRCAVELIDLPEAFTPGQISKVRVKVSYADGHKLLTGLPDGRDLWIELKLLDAKGRELYRRAAIKVSRAVAELRVMVPADAVGPVTVQAELNDGPGQQTAGAKLGASQPQEEITHLASATGQVPLSQLKPTVAERLLLLLALRSPR